MTSDTTFVVRDGRLAGREGTVDLVVEDGTIAEIGSTVSDISGSETAYDADGGLLSPGFVDCHMHLDMAYAAEFRGLNWNETARDVERFHELMNEYYADRSVADLAVAAERAIREAVANGTTHIRTHAMVDLDPGTETLRALLQAREATAHLAETQIVPYASRGILEEGNEALVRAALDLAFDSLDASKIRLGGMDPAGRNRAVERTLERWFELASEYDLGLDVHLQDAGATGAYVLEELLDRVETYGFAGEVTASHAFCLGHVPDWRAREIAERLAALDVGVLTCYTSTPTEMPLRQLAEAGVAVGHGTDNTHDFGFPHGAPDPLLGAFVEAVKLRGSRHRDADVGWFETNPGLRTLWRILTHGGARALDLEKYGLGVGMPATFLVADQPTPEAAIVNRATPRYVFKNGRLVAENRQVVA